MAKKKTAKTVAESTAVLKKPKKAKKVKRERRVNIEKLRELMKTHQPPQSWYDEDHTGLY